MKYWLFVSFLIIGIFSSGAQNALIDLYNPYYQSLVPVRTDSLFIRYTDPYQGTITREIGYKYADEGNTLLQWHEVRKVPASLQIHAIVQNMNVEENQTIMETTTTDSLTHRTFKDHRIFYGVSASVPDSILGEIWDSTQWLPNEKTIYRYHSNGFHKSRTDLRWDAAIEDWVPQYREIREYDPQNRLQSRRNEFWKEIEWRTLEQYGFSYQGLGSKPSATNWYSAANSGGALQPVDSMKIWYDGEGQIDSSFTFLWNPYSNTWAQTARTILNGEEQQKGNQGKDFIKGEDGAWVEKDDASFTPGEGLFTDEPQEVVTKRFDAKIDEWKDIRRKIVQYQPIEGGRIYGTLQVLEMNDSLQDWQEVFFAEAWLRVLPSLIQQDSVEDRSQKFTILYSCELPNPYVRNKTFLFPANEATGDYELKIFSADGRTVYRKKYDDSGMGYVDAPLQPGLYMASVSRGGTMLCTQKLIVQ